LKKDDRVGLFRGLIEKFESARKGKQIEKDKTEGLYQGLALEDIQSE